MAAAAVRYTLNLFSKMLQASCLTTSPPKPFGLERDGAPIDCFASSYR